MPIIVELSIARLAYGSADTWSQGPVTKTSPWTVPKFASDGATELKTSERYASENQLFRQQFFSAPPPNGM
jgi:hypothetical protein